MAKILTQEEVRMIAIRSGMEADVIKSWYKEFLKICPKGKMDIKQFSKFYKILRGLPDNKDLSKITDHVNKN
jgi:Ca2+-binding EF-hand superfamily protein